MKTKEEIQKLIDETHYQKFTLTEETVIPITIWEHEVKIMKEYFFDKLQGKTVIDIGCSHGLYSILCKQHGAKRVFGIEPYKPSFDLANEIKKYLNLDITYRNEQFNDALLYEGSFDYGICTSVYHYIYSIYQDHERIWQLFYQLCNEMFFEDSFNVDDEFVNIMFENDKKIEHLKFEYTDEKIKPIMEKYFEVQHIGTHLGGKREIYWLKRRKHVPGYKINELLFHNDILNTTVRKVQTKSGKIYILKEIDIEKQPNVMKSYENYEKIKHIDGIVKVYRTKKVDNKLYVLTEWLNGYKNIIHYEEPKVLKKNEETYTYLNGYKEYIDTYKKKLSKEQKKIVHGKMMGILSKLSLYKLFLFDFGRKNFMINDDLDVKMIDIDNLIDMSIYEQDVPGYPAQNFNLLHFYLYMKQMLLWMGE